MKDRQEAANALHARHAGPADPLRHRSWTGRTTQVRRTRHHLARVRKDAHYRGRGGDCSGAGLPAHLLRARRLIPVGTRCGASWPTGRSALPEPLTTVLQSFDRRVTSSGAEWSQIGPMKTKLCSLVLLASQLTFAAASRGADGFVAHEWGTFTSVQGADGIQLEWNPLVTSELPPFVYNSVRRIGGRIVWEGKGAYQTLQRMETPVIYFYSDTQQKVGVTVDFPQGIVTEWFPLGKQSAPSTANLPPRTGRQIIRWENIEILPLRQNASLAGALPSESSGSHYYAARATDADYLRVDASGAKGGAEVEKFL